MEKITQLVHSLSNREVKLFYKYNALSGKKTNNLKIRLFEIAKQNSRISDMDAAKLLGKKNNAAFSMLKSRLQNDILRVLVFTIDESRFFSKVYKARYEVHKHLAESIILDNRNLNFLSIDCINKADRLAEQFELIGARVIINEQLINSHQSLKGASAYNKFKNTAYKDLNTQYAITNAQDLIKQLTIPNLFVANRYKSKVEIAKYSSEQLQSLTENNSSARLNFLFLRSQMEYAELTHDFDKYHEIAHKFLELVLNNPPVRTSDNIGGAYMLIAVSALHLKKGADSLHFSKLAEEYFFKNSNNYLTLMGLRYVALIILNDVNSATELVTEIRSLKTIKRGSFQYSKWLYYEANLKFVQKDFQGSLNLLKRQSFLKTDKSGWRIGYKILEMLCIVDLEHYDWLPYRLETFRKLLKQILKENISRPTLIHKILSRLVRENFNFISTNKKMSQEIEKLKLNSGDYHRIPISYEVIPFETWWDEKLKSQKRRKSEG